MKTEQAIVGLIAAGVGAYFLLRPQTSYAAARPIDAGPWQAPYGPPVVTGGTYVDPLEELFMPRGIRNHNPMNLRYVAAFDWDGQIGPDDAGYARFDTVIYGIRAGVKNLVNGYFKKGIDSPINIIERYAPHVENPTDNYIRFVAEKMGIDKTTSIPLNQPNMERLTKAIIEFENGSQPYTSATIAEGVNLGLTT